MKALRAPLRARDPATAPDRGFGARLMTPLLLGAVLNPLNSTMIATGLVAIGRDFGTGPSGTAWLLSSLYLTSAVGQPVMGRLADSLGPRRVFLAGLAVVCAGGLLGTFAPAFAWLIAARVLLGLGTSAAYPAAMAMLRAESLRTGRPAPRPVMGRLSLAALGSAALGPTLGGLLTATTGWRGIFAVNVPLALLALAVALPWLPHDRRRPAAAGTAPASTAPDGTGPDGGDTGPVRPRQGPVRPQQPSGGPSATTPPRGALLRTYLRHGLTYLAIYCALYGYAQWLEEARGCTSVQAGLVMLPMSLAAAACSLLGARTKGLRAPLTTAAALLAAGSGILVTATGGTPLAALLIASALFGIPQGLASTGNQAAVYAQAPPDRVGSAAGLQRTAQYTSAMAATGLLALCFGQQASDAGLHRLAAVTGALSLLLIALTATDRALRARTRT
ncbi:MFS transporter [Streptomyces roseifaciens]|uniref:MFS transporter n=1 Tax=Streptomyces roseifaciens TaxID=1488406 RepID=UPI0007183008|nr:MFS transporter [Streptomyces roseifaciens]